MIAGVDPYREYRGNGVEREAFDIRVERFHIAIVFRRQGFQTARVIEDQAHGYAFFCFFEQRFQKRFPRLSRGDDKVFGENEFFRAAHGFHNRVERFLSRGKIGGVAVERSGIARVFGKIFRCAAKRRGICGIFRRCGSLAERFGNGIKKRNGRVSRFVFFFFRNDFPIHFFCRSAGAV